MYRKEQEPTTIYLAQELRDASAGSFPLSPGVMAGHYATANLYAHFRRDTFRGKQARDIFGTDNPTPPILKLPPGHRTVHVDNLNKQVWRDFINAAFGDEPIDPRREVRNLIRANADVDDANFFKRLKGEKSRLVGSEPTPSLLRAFVYEGKFPIKNEFFTWLFQEVKSEIHRAADNNYEDDWATGLGCLVRKWETYYEDTPFIQEDQV